MFERLFAESGLSLDRLRAFLEVGASGSIVKAAGGDPVRQSQYSRQIKELEDFFRTMLVEREGKGMQLTTNGRELARISRFFMLGLAKFQRGCRDEEQTFRIGASTTIIQRYLAPVLAGRKCERGSKYSLEVASDDEVERRLHDLTLDFGIVTRENLSRPLQTREIGKWKLNLAVPKKLCASELAAIKQFKAGCLPLALARKEMDEISLALYSKLEPVLECENFLSVLSALRGENLAGILPDFLGDEVDAANWLTLRIPGMGNHKPTIRLAWNPRLVRLNPGVARTRESLAEGLRQVMRTRKGHSPLQL